MRGGGWLVLTLVPGTMLFGEPSSRAASDASSSVSVSTSSVALAANAAPGAEIRAESGPAPMVRRDARTSGRFGIDFRLGLQNGMLGAPAALGIDLSYTPWAPISLYAGVDSNGATVAGHVDAQVNLLTFFTRAPWTPFVRAGYAQFWFTSLADDILDAAAPELRDSLSEAGTDLRFAGVHMHLLHVGGGIDVVSRGGFHFQTLVGRSFLVGESQGRDAEESVQLTEYQSWNLTFSIGWQFR